MPKKLTVTIVLDNDDESVPNDSAGLSDLLYGINDGQVAGCIEGVQVVTPVPVAPDEKYVSDPRTVGDLRAFLAGLPDCAELRSRSGSMESYVSFGLAYGPVYDECEDKYGPAGLVIRNEY